MMSSYGYPAEDRGSIFDDDRRVDAARHTPYNSEHREHRERPAPAATHGPPPRPNSVTFQDDVECVCGARQHVQRIQHDLRRRTKQLDNDWHKMRQRFDDLRKRERQLAEVERELTLRDEEMKSYKTYLQDKQQSISQLQQQNDSTQRALLQRLDECATLEEECRRRLGEYESGLGDMGKKEAMLNETSRALTSRRDEIERLEHKLLIETERLKDVRDQCAAAREQVAQELKQHKRRVDDELELVEMQKRKVAEMENSFLDEKAAFDEYMRAKKRDVELRLREVADSNDTNDAIANDLRKREQAISQEMQRIQAERDEIKTAREKIKAEWDKVNEALDEIRSAKSEVKSIKRACNKQKRLLDQEIDNQSRQLHVAASEPTFQYQQSPLSHETLRDIKQAEAELQVRAKHVEIAADELREKQIELSEYAAQLKQRELALKEAELKLERLQDALDAREKELEDLQAELMNSRSKSHQFEAQLHDYREQMALLAIERNSLEGQKAQFEKMKIAKEAELNATRQRLERKEQELDAKLARYRGLKDSQQLENKIEAIRSAKTTSAKVSNRAFSIPNKQNALGRRISAEHGAAE